MIEIERKFLVTSEAFKLEAFQKTKIQQGFLNTHKKRTVRIRTKGKKGYITVKGLSSKDGLQRFEWEKEIPLEEAQTLLKLCEDTPIEKVRYEVKVGPHVFEVDEFFKENRGLIVAEVELKTINETIKKPTWLGEEVTGDIKFYNAQLSKNPYNSWKSIKTNKT